MPRLLLSSPARASISGPKRSSGEKRQAKCGLAASQRPKDQIEESGLYLRAEHFDGRRLNGQARNIDGAGHPHGRLVIPGCRDPDQWVWESMLACRCHGIHPLATCSRNLGPTLSAIKLAKPSGHEDRALALQELPGRFSSTWRAAAWLLEQILKSSENLVDHAFRCLFNPLTAARTDVECARLIT